MEKLKRSLSIRKKKIPRLESSKPHQWQEDERKVRDGTCSFQVKYLGCVEVYESRGIQICEEAVKVLKAKKSRSAWSRLSFRKKKDDSQQPKSGHHRAVLYVTGDALRVVDEISKGLIVDQTIEKVSFCAPDRNHEKGFAYICRDGTTRRWLCHGFFAVKESGERLSHAVGCAFAICLEKKQQREKEKVSVTYNENGTSFTRMGSFRQTTLTERLTDPQSAIVAEPVPFKPTELPFAVQRPHAPANILDRQGSFRGFNKLAESSPFKRNTSLRVNELPSTLERQKQFSGIDGPQLTNGKTQIISTIIEDEELPASMLEEPSGSQWPVLDTFSALKLNNTVSVQTTAIIQPPPPVAQSTVQPPYSTAHGSAFAGPESLQLKNSQIVTSLLGNIPAGNSHIENPQLGVVVKQTNPWAAPKPQQSRSSEAENWLNSTANRIDPFAAVPPPCAVGVSRQRSVNSFGGQSSVAMATPPIAPFQAAPAHESNPMAQAHAVYPSSVAAVPVVAQHQILADHRFQSSAVDRSWMTGGPGSSLTGGTVASSHGTTVEHFAVARGSVLAPSGASVAPAGTVVVPSTDPFDSAWAASATGKSANPFHPAGASFQVKI